MAKQNEIEGKRRQLLKAMGGGAILASVGGLAACSGDKAEQTPSRPQSPPTQSPPTQSPPTEAAPTEAPPTQAAPQPVADAVTEQAAEMTDGAMAEGKSAVTKAAGQMPRLAEDDPQAQALAYVNDATTTDAAKYPRYQAGQICANCALFIGDEGESWAACSISPGKQVNAAGWCSVYAPKA